MGSTNQYELVKEKWLTSGKLKRTPQVMKTRDAICGSVAMTGDLVMPESEV
jgi:hypothetical protein